MKARLVCYDLSKISQINKVLVKRQLFGYTEYSNNAQYQYQRKGILSDIPHLKLARAVLIVKTKDEPKIHSIIRKVKGKYQSFPIEIKRDRLY